MIAALVDILKGSSSESKKPHHNPLRIRLRLCGQFLNLKSEDSVNISICLDEEALVHLTEQVKNHPGDIHIALEGKVV